MGRTELLRKNEICTFGNCIEHRQSERTYLREEAVNPLGTLGGWSQPRLLSLQFLCYNLLKILTFTLRFTKISFLKCFFENDRIKV